MNGYIFFFKGQRVVIHADSLLAEIKTAELIGLALDWAVELAKGTHWSANGYFCFTNPKRFDNKPEYRYSTDWSQGGLILDKEGITVGPHTTSPAIAHYGPVGITLPWVDRYVGPTMLIAGMRCFVASKLGDEIDIPKEILC